MTNFFIIYAEISKNILDEYQWLIGIVFTAGLSLLIYFKILRINNFLAYSQKYQENLRRFAFMEKIKLYKDEIVYIDTEKELEDEESLNLPIIYNLLSEIGLLYRKGLIDRDLAYKHFGNIVYSVYTKKRDIINRVQIHTKTDNIEFLFKAFGRKGIWGDRIIKIKNFVFKKKFGLSWRTFLVQKNAAK